MTLSLGKGVRSQSRRLSHRQTRASLGQEKEENIHCLLQASPLSISFLVFPGFHLPSNPHLALPFTLSRCPRVLAHSKPMVAG